MNTEIKERRPPLDTAAAAIYTGAKPNYLEKLRCVGGVPSSSSATAWCDTTPTILMRG
jgi:hypothetical protein